MSKELREQFEKETGMNFFQFPMLYAKWLEAKLKEAEEGNKELLNREYCKPYCNNKYTLIEGFSYCPDCGKEFN